MEPAGSRMVTEPTTRLQSAVYLGMPWPPRQGFIPVLYWPPQVAEKEEEDYAGAALKNFENFDVEQQLDEINMDDFSVSNFLSHGGVRDSLEIATPLDVGRVFLG